MAGRGTQRVLVAFSCDQRVACRPDVDHQLPGLGLNLLGGPPHKVFCACLAVPKHKEVEKFREERIGVYGKVEIMQLYSHATAEPHSFLRARGTKS